METFSAARVGTEGRTRTRLLGALLVLGAALLLAGGAASLPGAPAYTDWSPPVNLGPVVNSGVVPGSTGADFGPAISADGLSLYFASNRLLAGVGVMQDIWLTKRATLSAPWGAPVDLGPPINTAAGTETVPTFSTDGHWMFFGASGRPGFGGTDIYQSYRADIHDDFGWQTPTNLGANVNTASEEIASTYFDNGGHPQLIFGSNKPSLVAASVQDLFVSNLQPDGTWGPATPVAELNSAANENRPNIRPDGLEIFFYSDRPGGAGGSDLWTATRASTDAPWSTPVNVTALNTSAGDVHPYLSADGRTLYFGSSRPGGSGGTDLWVTTRAAKLSLTANDQTRLFGQANPPLTYAITDFVGGETSSVVSGAAACTTTASPSSPAGDYPIACTLGTLSAAGYVFSTFNAGTLTVTYSSPCLTGTRSGPLTVAAGQAICIAAGGNQTGQVTVSPGGALDVEGGRITGPLTATGAAAVRLCGATLTGPLTVTGSTGPVLVGGGPCAGNTIFGPVNLIGNTAGVEASGNTITGPLRITGNTGPVHATANTVTGPMTIQS